jgi:hypothetical protein
MDRLLEEYTDAGVAEQLNRASLPHLRWAPLGDASMSINCVGITGLQIGSHEGLARGLLTADELAHSYGVTAQTIWRWYRQGRIVGMCYNDRGSCLFLPQESQPLLTETK